MHFLLKVDLQNSILTLDGDKDVRDITGGHFIIIHPYLHIYIYIYRHSFLSVFQILQYKKFKVKTTQARST